jgi:hypothetical protein
MMSLSPALYLLPSGSHALVLPVHTFISLRNDPSPGETNGIALVFSVPLQLRVLQAGHHTSGSHSGITPSLPAAIGQGWARPPVCLTSVRCMVHYMDPLSRSAFHN